MSVLIRGEKMPESCEECQSTLGLFSSECPLFKDFPKKFVGESELLKHTRFSNCPLVEIPPHGDLIDGTKLLNDVADVVENKLKQGDISAEDIWTIIMGAFNYAPTIIEREEEE